MRGKRVAILLVLVGFVAAGVFARDISGQPLYGTQRLEAGFIPDPAVVQLDAGGSDEIPSDIGYGYIYAAAPDVDLVYEAGSFARYIYVESDDDTVLLLNSPDGQWHFDDNSVGVNPVIVFPKPQSGMYNIWVGTFGGSTADAQLMISELDPRCPAFCIARGLPVVVDSAGRRAYFLPVGARLICSFGERYFVKAWLAAVLVLSMAGVAYAQPVELTLPAFLELVERNSLALDSARIEQGITETDVTVTRALTRPSIGAQASLTRSLLESEQAVPGMGGITVDPFNEFSGGIVLQQLIFDLRAFRALEASRRADDLTASVFEARRQAVLTGAKKLFYQAILLEEVVAVRGASEELAREAYDDVRSRAAAGVASRLDVLRAELAWRSTVPEVTQAERNSAVARANLRAFAGIEPGAELRLLGSLNDVPPRPAGISLPDALDARPDVQALRGARTLRELGVAAQRAEFYPSLSGSVTWGWSASDEGLSFTDPTQTLRAGLQLQVPIYSGGARMGRLNRARLELETADVELNQAINDIRTELERIELSLSEAEARVESARSTVATAELAFEMTQLSVDAGISTQLELKDARVSLVSAQLALYAASFDFLSAFFDRQAAVGRGADPLP